MDYKDKQNRSEISLQFDEIFENYYDPDKKIDRIIKERRKKRGEDKKLDVGL